MFSFDTDTKEIARLLGINPAPITPSDGDILKPFGANQPPIPGAADAIALPTLVSVACDNLVIPLDMSVDQGKIPVETDSHTAMSVDSLTGIALANSYEQLQQFANSPEFLSQMSIAFGDDFDVEAAQDLADSLTNGTFEIPPTRVISAADIDGANGAFAAETNNIYLASEFVAENADNPEAIVSVLLEEIGHYIDSQINISDTPGDEGAIFAGVVQGGEFDAGELEALMAVDDTATVMINGQATLIEQSSSRGALLTQQNANYFRDRPQFYTTGNIFAQSMFGSSLVGGRGSTEGNCTWYAHGRVKELGGSVAALNSMLGNANQWHTQLSNGALIVSDPQPGDIAQWTRNGQNHVAVVERVYQQNGVRRVILSESHWNSNFDGGGAGTLHRIVDYTASNPDRYIRVPGVLASTEPTQPSTSAFRGTVDGSLNIRSGPGTNNSIVGSLSPGHSRTFDAVARGTTHWDAREQRNDDRWFRVSGTNQWVSGAFITGNPLFNGTADTTLNIRSGPGTNFPVVASLSTGNGRTFDATTVGTTHWDPKEGKNENRWFRLKDTNNWVSAAFITGNPTY